jgi:hypothetical protein
MAKTVKKVKEVKEVKMECCEDKCCSDKTNMDCCTDKVNADACCTDKCCDTQKCGCKPCVGFLGVILMVVGIYFLVWGFQIQMITKLSWSVWNWTSMLMYLIGILALLFGKMAKHKGFCCCKEHSM